MVGLFRYLVRTRQKRRRRRRRRRLKSIASVTTQRAPARPSGIIALVGKLSQKQLTLNYLRGSDLLYRTQPIQRRPARRYCVLQRLIVAATHRLYDAIAAIVAATITPCICNACNVHLYSSAVSLTAWTQHNIHTVGTEQKNRQSTDISSTFDIAVRSHMRHNWQFDILHDLTTVHMAVKT